MCHVSSTCVTDARELVAHAADFADAVLLLPPWYFADAPPDGIVEFFKECAWDCPLPVYAYNFPRHTQISLTPELIGEVRNVVPQLRGLKDSGGNFEMAQALKHAHPELEVYIGADAAVLRTLQAGLDGSVTGGGNPLPHHFVQIQQAVMAGDTKAGEHAQAVVNQWTAFRKTLPCHEIAVVKAALSVRIKGFPIYVRPPLCAVTEADHLGGIRTALT